MINIPWYGYAHKKIALHRDKNADKIAFKSSLDDVCGAYSKNLDRMMQYSCKNPQAVVYYSAPQDKTWSIETLVDGTHYSNTPIAPYKGGIIGISYSEDSDAGHYESIVGVSDTGEVRLYQQPDNISRTDFAQARIFTDEQNQANDRFVLVEKNGAIHLATPGQDKDNPAVNYTTIPAPATYSPTLEQTQCHLQDTSVICYRGLATNIGDSTEDTAKVQPQIIKLTFGSEKTTITPIGDSLPIFDFDVTNDGQLYGLSYKKLIRFTQKSNTYYPEELSQNVDSIAAGDKLYFLQNNGVFTIDPTSHDAYQVFYSHNIQPDKLLTSSDRVFIIGKSVNNSEDTYAWRLNDDDDVNYSNRLIDILPSFPASSAYGRTDLVGNTLDIQVLASRIDTEADIRRKKQATLDYLKDLGVNIDQLTIANF